MKYLNIKLNNSNSSIYAALFNLLKQLFSFNQLSICEFEPRHSSVVIAAAKLEANYIPIIRHYSEGNRFLTEFIVELS